MKELQEACKKFEEQFEVKLEPTGYFNDAKINGGIEEQEFFVKDFHDSPFLKAMNITIGGWFCYDMREPRPSIYCDLSAKIKGNETTLHIDYDREKKKWYNIHVGYL